MSNLEKSQIYLTLSLLVLGYNLDVSYLRFFISGTFLLNAIVLLIRSFKHYD